MKPHPISASGADRDTCCAHYSACLDVAIRRGWDGFSCRECPVRGTAIVPPEPMARGTSAAQVAIDAAGPRCDFTPEERRRMTTQPGRRGEAFRNYRIKLYGRRQR